MFNLHSTFYILHSQRKGQSLVEVLVAVAVGLILIMGAVAVIGPAIKGSTDASRTQAGIALADALLGNVRVWGESSWHNITNLSTSSANHYYLNTSSSPFAAVAGDESVAVATTTYTRYFYVDDVGRDTGGKIVGSGGTNDPSTKKITVVYRWPQGATHTISAYLSRSKNNVFLQTDWSGGGGQAGPATTTNSRFASSSNIDFSTSTGSILIKFQ